VIEQLVFHHQDGDIAFSIVAGVYHLSPSGVFSCSISCAGNDDHDYMAAPHLAALHVVAGRALAVGQVLTIDAQATSDAIVEKRPLAHLYAGQHYSPWQTRLTIKAVDGHFIRVHGTFITDDPNYYDDRAKATNAEFMASLKVVSSEEVWDPL
jgi:hypothetical protein